MTEALAPSPGITFCNPLIVSKLSDAPVCLSVMVSPLKAYKCTHSNSTEEGAVQEFPDGCESGW